MEGVDFSFDRPGAAALVAEGKEFVIRYIPYPGDGGKGLTLSEVAEYGAAGLAIGLVFESTAARHLDGYDAGVQDAHTAGVACDALGLGAIPIYFAVDFDAKPTQMALIDEYQRGAISVLGLMRVGVYGSFAVIDHCHFFGTAAWFWQTYAWSSGVKHPYRHLYQYSNGESINRAAVDFCEAYGTEQGLWWPGTEGGEVTEERVKELIKEAFDAGYNSGAIASTTDVLACLAQIAGAEPLTYTDTARVEAVRAALGVKA